MTDSREVPEEIMDWYLCERLGVRMAELQQMAVEDVWGGLAYMHGRDVAQAARQQHG